MTMRPTSRALNYKSILAFALLLSFSLSAQNRVVMMNTFGGADESLSEKSSSVNSDAAYTQAMNEIDSLQEVVLDLKRELHEVTKEKEALLNYNRELVQSDLQKSRDKKTDNRVEVKKSVEEAMSFENCMEATSFQPLFAEKIEVQYSLDESKGTFVGQLVHTYTPEIGKREYNTQQVKGTFVRTLDVMKLHIKEIDMVPTDVVFSVHDRSYKSFVKCGESAAALPYTKVVSVEDLKLGYCLF